MPNMTFKLSPSTLVLFSDCPRCFWLHMHGHWKRPSGPFPSLPAGMDAVLKKHFDSFRDKGELPPELREKGECKGLKLFGTTPHEKQLLEEWRNWKKGLSWKDNEGNILTGALDNLLKKENNLLVLDYKTRGYPLKEDTHEHYIDQMNIYNLILRKMGHKTEEYSYLLFYVPSKVLATGEVIFDTHLVKIPADTAAAEKLFKKAISFLQGKCPEHHKEKLCEWCAHVEHED